MYEYIEIYDYAVINDVYAAIALKGELWGRDSREYELEIINNIDETYYLEKLDKGQTSESYMKHLLWAIENLDQFPESKKDLMRFVRYDILGNASPEDLEEWGFSFRLKIRSQ